MRRVLCYIFHMAKVNKSQRLILRIVLALVEYLERVAADRRKGRCEIARRAMVLGLRQTFGLVNYRQESWLCMRNFLSS
jgi:hypothetical protein